jgi:two-component system, response regulator YesN
MYKMIVVDDEYLVRMGIRETIDWQDYGIEIIGEADNGKSGLKMALELKPDLILSDIKMPVMDGLELVKQIMDLQLDCTVVILSGYKDFDYAKGTLENGAYSYLLKPIDNEELISTVKEALERLLDKRKTRHYYERLENQLPSLKEKMLSDLLNNNNDVSELEKNMELYHVDIPSKGHLIYGQIDGTNGLTEEEVKEALQALHEIIINQLKKLENDSNSQTYFEDASFVIFDALDQDSILAECEQAMREFEKQSNAIVTLCISECYEQYQDIHEAYINAKNTASNKLFPMLNQVLFVNQEEERYKPQVIEVMNYIAENYNQNLTIKTVADSLYISESYLMHMFKDNVGKTFNEVLTEYRMLIAKKLLLTNKYKVYEIAEMVGYNDVKYFSQVFRKKEGLSPSQFINNQE